MTKARKTVEVRYVLDRVNTILRVSPPENVEGRKAVANLLESVLLYSGTYRGYGYVESHFDENGVYQGHEFARFKHPDTDESRRQYYRHPVLD